jgi:hypothetical protein
MPISIDVRYIMLLLITAATSFGQTYQIKDRHGIPMVEISNVEMFRYSENFHTYIPDVKATARNVYGKDWNNDPSYDFSLLVTVRKKNGSKADFKVSIDICVGCDFGKDAVQAISHSFYGTAPYAQDNFESVEFSFPAWFQSPEDKRLAAIEQVRKDAADAARREREAAEKRKREAGTETAERERKVRVHRSVPPLPR